MAWRIFLALTLALAASETPGDDPLAHWLSSLKLKLPDIQQKKAGITLNVSSLVCQKLSLTDVQSKVEGIGLAMTLVGIGIECSGNLEYHGLGIVSGHGELSAVVTPGPSSTAAVTLEGVGMDHGVPWKVEVPACSTALSFQLHFSGGVVAAILSSFTKTFEAQISDSIEKQVCGGLRDTAATVLTDKLGDFNRIFLPDSEWTKDKSWKTSEATTFKVLSDAEMQDEGSTVNWQEDVGLRWVNWAIVEVVGPEGVNHAISLAFQNSSNASLPGPAFAVMNSSFQQAGAGIALQVEVFVKELAVEGAESVREFSPLHAAHPDELEFNLSFGTTEQPSTGLRTHILAHVKSVDLSSGEAQASIDQELSFHLGLSHPALALRAEVLVDEAEWQTQHTLGQLLIGAKSCFTSVLKRSPVLRSLKASFQGLSAPLSFEAKTKSQLEESLAQAANNAITLFNLIYQVFLPETVSRLADSETVLKAANDAAEANLQPGQCPSVEEAAKAVKDVVPKTYSDWPPIFENFLRKVVDNVIDGFLKQNTSKLSRSLVDMPQIRFPPVEEVKLREILITGMNQIKHLTFLPNDERPTSLGMQVEVQCPTKSEPWKPMLVVNGSVSAGNFGGDGAVSVMAPCGSFKGKAEVEVDLWSLLSLKVPPSLSCALLSPLSRLDFFEFESNFSGFDLTVQHTGNQSQEPLQELCKLHPAACVLASSIVQAVSNPAGIRQVSDTLQKLILTQCEGEAPSPDGERRDTLGYGFVEADSSFWLSGLAVVLALAVTYVICGVIGRRLMEDEDKSSLCTLCLTGTPGARIKAQAMTLFLSLLLAAGLVGRVLAYYWLPFANAGGQLIQKPSTAEVGSATLLEFTFFGISEQFLRGGSSYCHVLWLLTSLVASFISNGLLLLVWLTPVLAAHRRTMLLVALFLARFPLSELETISNVALCLNSDVQFPLDLQASLRTGLEVGAYLSWFSSVLSLLSILWLLTMVPGGQRSWQGSKTERLAQGCACLAMIIGLLLWIFSAYIHIETGGLGGAMIEPQDKSALALGESDGVMRFFLLATCFGMPGLQMMAFLFTEVKFGASQIMAEVGATFCILDLFTLGYLLTFLEGVDGFSSSAAHELLRPVCELTQHLVGEDCLEVKTSVVWPGLLGMVLATLASLTFTAIQVVMPMRRSNSVSTSQRQVEVEFS
mmetsp:Transcript_104157/g.184980  ORF Transcript_104157/g.184980 Transcript_104157/m.184980 type:complete len:1182 (+) Transcript_104157:79-3624(+)